MPHNFMFMWCLDCVAIRPVSEDGAEATCNLCSSLRMITLDEMEKVD